MPFYRGTSGFVKVYRKIIPFCKIYRGTVLKHWAADCQGCVKYGYLYNWYAVNDARNIANTGWHVPTWLELRDLWQTLDPDGNDYNNTAGGDLKETGTTYWNSPNTGATNLSGFFGRGTGLRNPATGAFGGILSDTYFWSSTSLSSISAAGSELQYDSASFAYTSMYKLQGNPVRLVKDDDTVANYTGNDGKTYNTVKIGSKVWMSENLAETEYRDHSVISIVEDPVTWVGMLTGAMCAYDNDYTNVGCGETDRN